MRRLPGSGGNGCVIGCGAGALLMLLVPMALFGFGRDAALVKPTGQLTGTNCSNAIDFVKNAEYLPWVADAAGKYLKGDQAILIALIQTESSWDPKAGAGTSSAAGLGQFISSTARGYKEFTGGQIDGITWAPGKVYDNPDSNSDDARFDPKRSIYAAGRKFGNDMKRYGDNPVEAYMRGYHTYKNDQQKAEAQKGADRMMAAYTKLRTDGGCTNETLAGATPFNCSGKKFVFPIVSRHLIPIDGKHHDYSATDIFVKDGERNVAGDPVVSITDGEVASISKQDQSDGGVTVRIVDRDNISYYYAHLQVGSNRHLTRGEKVSAGQVIGKVGDTGNAKGPGPHLHLGIAKREGPQHKGFFPSQVIDPRENGGKGSGQESNITPLNAWKKGECADPRT